MKTTRLISILVASAALASTGCQKLESLFGKGDITFTSSTRGSLLSRAEYGDTYEDEGKKYYQVKWTAGDKISIACAQCSKSEEGSVTKYDYTVTDISSESHVSTAKLTKDESIGLRWGDNGDYKFFAVSPAQGDLGTDGKVSFSLPQTQTQTQGTASAWSDDTFKVAANPDYMLMTSFCEVSKTGVDAPDVPLVFSFIPTVFDLIITGESEMSIKIVKLSSTDQYLSGTVNLAIQESGYPLGYLSETGSSKDVSIEPVYNSSPVEVSTTKALEALLFVPSYEVGSTGSAAVNVTNLSLSVTFSLDGGTTYQTLSTKLQKKNDSIYEYLSFAPHVRHTIKGLVVPSKSTIEVTAEDFNGKEWDSHGAGTSAGDIEGAEW